MKIWTSPKFQNKDLGEFQILLNLRPHLKTTIYPNFERKY